MRPSRPVLLLLAAALASSGCFGPDESSSDGDARGAPVRTANDGPDAATADAAPFTLPSDPHTVWHPLVPPSPWPGAAGGGTTPRSTTATYPCGGVLASPEPAVTPLGPTEGTGLGGAATLSVEVSATPAVSWSYHGGLMPQGRPPNRSFVAPAGFPALGAARAPGPAVVGACAGETSGMPPSAILTSRLTPVTGVPGPEVPHRLVVPTNATRLLARPFHIGSDGGVLAHFTLLREDGSLVSHEGLGRSQNATVVSLAPGTYVLHVDHAADGFLQFALDGPGGTLAPLPVAVEEIPVGRGPGERTVNLPEGLLAVLPGFRTAPGAPEATWQGVEMGLQGAHQPVFTWRPADGYVRGDLDGREVGPTAFTKEEFTWDHHAVDAGPHRLTVTGDALDGDVFLRVYTVPA